VLSQTPAARARSFEAIRATERFYLANGFAPLGPRMRRKL